MTKSMGRESKPSNKQESTTKGNLLMTNTMVEVTSKKEILSIKAHLRRESLMDKVTSNIEMDSLL